MCPNGHVVDRHRSSTSSCEVIVFAQPGTSLQHCINNFTHSTGSKCPTCDTCLLRTTSFVQSPPVIIFNIGACASVPSLSSVLWITCGETGRVHYNLKGIVYYKGQHFTSCFVTGTSMIWFHDVNWYFLNLWESRYRFYHYRIRSHGILLFLYIGVDRKNNVTWSSIGMLVFIWMFKLATVTTGS